MKAYVKGWLTVLALALAALAMITLTTQPAHAAGPWYVAPGGNDSNDCLSPGPAHACATINGALNKPGFVAGDTIRVATGAYTGTGSEVVLLDKNATLSGGWDATFTTQSGTSTIDGQGSRRGITVYSVATAIIERFSVQNGYAMGSGAGGVRNSGNLILNGSTITGNRATTDGGGILNLGTLTLNNSTVSNNTAGESGGIGNGGVWTSLPVTMTLNNSTVSNNTADSRGGGIGNGPSGTLTLNNCTVSGNTSTYAPGSGGIYNDGTATLNSSTISGNTAGSGDGGGIYGGVATLQNTIVAGNTAGSAPDCSGTIGSAGYNLIGNTSGCTFAPASGDLINIDPKLELLEGSPGYHPLLTGSPAINAGNPAGCTDHLGNPLLTDQRGMPRVGRCDIGAYEVGLTATKQASGTYVPGSALTYIITLNNAASTAITGVRITDTVPISLTYVADSFSATNGTGGESGGVITWNGTVPAGGSTAISFRATISDDVPSCSLITNKATIGGQGYEFERQVTGATPCVCNLTKHAGNPVLSVGAGGSWDDDDVWSPAVLKEGGTYKMWYTGDDGSSPTQIGLATSTNGMNWTKEAANPVLSPGQSWEVEGVRAGSVIYDGGLYKMWYTGYDSGWVGRIGYATSPDGVAWTKHGSNPVLDVGASGSWEDDEVSGPTVIKEGGTYHMWYTGYDGMTSRIGHATSSNGTNWTKDPANPVLDIGPPGDWDWLGVYSPNVVKVGAEYNLWYSGGTLPQAWQTGYALSSDGSDWTRGEMLIPEGAPGIFDSHSADYPSVIVDGDEFKVWYSGLNEGGIYNIGYATAEICSEAGAPPSNLVYLPIILKGGGAQPPCPAYYTDNFGDPGSGWPVDDDSNRKYAYTGGEYQIWVKNPSWWAGVTPGAKATDFAAAVSARRASGSGGSYGIIFGINEDWSEFYRFEIGPNNYRISEYDNGTWTHLRNWTTSNHIRTGTNWNRLKVIREGANIAVYVNNQHLATVTDGSFTGLRRIGLVAVSPSSSSLDARFDDFSLYPASCGPSAAGVGFEMGEPGIHEAPMPPGLDQLP
jgi:uncharacterized repeat protein (TIGR01451 family)